VADVVLPDVLDAAALGRLAELRALAGHDVLGELIALFTREVPPQIAACLDAFARGEVEALRHAAHAARGVAAQIGASELAALCTRVEAGAAAGVSSHERGALDELVDALEPAFHRARTALEGLDTVRSSIPR
jgi:HPt (histidine-containing phosphotransfer) domain-containing protein